MCMSLSTSQHWLLPYPFYSAIHLPAGVVALPFTSLKLMFDFGVYSPILYKNSIAKHKSIGAINSNKSIPVDLNNLIS